MHLYLPPSPLLCKFYPDLFMGKIYRERKEESSEKLLGRWQEQFRRLPQTVSSTQDIL